MDTPKIKVVEVSPRDGLQNEATVLATALKTEFINRLSKTGLSWIEVGSFVSPKSVPQLADGKALFAAITRLKGVHYSALVPNERGFRDALASEVDSVAVFTAASNQFCQKNIHCTIEESIARFKPVVALAKQRNIPVRAYISCVLGCPYEGKIDASRVSGICRVLWALGCQEISLGDTIGAGTPKQVRELLAACVAAVPIEKLAVHFHDTRGQALANILASLACGIRVIDSSVAGLGGCPYAAGASGNVATEDLIYMLHGMGYETGVNLPKLISVGNFISNKLNRRNQSKVASVGLQEGVLAP